MNKNKIVVMVLGFLFIGSHLYGQRQIDITVEILQKDTDTLKKYVIEGIAPNIPRAKQAGKRIVHLVAGISYYAFDSIPWTFFEDEPGMREAFERICNEVCASYIQAGKEKYKTTVQRKRPRLSRSRLGEFLHRHMIDTLNLSDEHKELLNKEPAKTDEFMQQGIISKDDYMYYNLLGLLIQYYLEKEFGKHR